MAAGVVLWDHDDDEVIEEVEDQISGEPVGDDFRLVDGTQIVGTQGDDVLTDADLNELDVLPNFESYSIDGGAGADLIDFDGANTSASPSPQYATIEGGDGNDTISYDGGPSNSNSPTIVGGEGDDLITVGNSSGFEVRAEGGAGNDTIDASSAASGRYSGGDGDDFIVTAGGGLSGEGHVNSADGGDGDDTIRFDAFTNFDGVDSAAVQSVSGDAGADRFEVLVDEGGRGAYDDAPNDLTSDVSRIDGSTLRVQAFSVDDFEPGEDLLSLEVSTQDEAYSLSSIRMEEYAGRDGGLATHIILSYQNEGTFTREVVVRLGATGVTWDDVDLVGADRSHLVSLMT